MRWELDSASRDPWSAARENLVRPAFITILAPSSSPDTEWGGGRGANQLE